MLPEFKKKINKVLWCFLLLALVGLGEFPWIHHSKRGRFAVTACILCGDLLFCLFRAAGVSVTCSVPLEGGTEWVGTVRIRRSNSLLGLYTSQALCCPNESLDISCPCVRGSQSRNTLGGSDSKHPAASLSWRLLQTTDRYLRDKWQQGRPISLQDGFIIHSPNLCLGRQIHHHVHSRWRHDTRRYTRHTMLDRWFRALKLWDTVGLWP